MQTADWTRARARRRGGASLARSSERLAREQGQSAAAPTAPARAPLAERCHQSARAAAPPLHIHSTPPPPAQANHMPEIQRYMGCIVFAGRPISCLPPQYASLLSADAGWAAVEAEFTKQACSLMGQVRRARAARRAGRAAGVGCAQAGSAARPHLAVARARPARARAPGPGSRPPRPSRRAPQAAESPLAVVVAAGSVTLPALVKMAGVMERSGQDYDSCDQLPTDIHIPSEFIFHSTFACPVSKDQSTPENPPKLLPCGHVLCEQSITKIADRSRTRVFKCPYCPLEARADNTRALVFPDVI